MIKKRIADRKWDDVVRVVPPPLEKAKKELELDDSRSKKVGSVGRCEEKGGKWDDVVRVVPPPMEKAKKEVELDDSSSKKVWGGGKKRGQVWGVWTGVRRGMREGEGYASRWGWMTAGAKS